MSEREDDTGLFEWDDENPNGRFYCELCRTWTPTDGASRATESQLNDELEEHLADYHD